MPSIAADPKHVLTTPVRKRKPVGPPPEPKSVIVLCNGSSKYTLGPLPCLYEQQAEALTHAGIVPHRVLMLGATEAILRVGGPV